MCVMKEGTAWLAKQQSTLVRPVWLSVARHGEKEILFIRVNLNGPMFTVSGRSTLAADYWHFDAMQDRILFIYLSNDIAHLCTNAHLFNFACEKWEEKSVHW